MHESEKIEIRFRDVARFAWGYISRRPFVVILVFLLLVIQTLAELTMPYALGLMLDFVEKGVLFGNATFVGVLPFFGMVLMASVVYHSTQFCAHITYDRFLKMPARRDAVSDSFGVVQRFSTNWHNDTFAGATVTKLKRGMSSLEVFLDSFYLHFIPLTFVIVGVITFLSVRFQLLGLVFAAGAIMYTALSIWMSMRFVAPISRALADQDSRVGAVLADSLSCNATVKMFGTEKTEHTHVIAVMRRWCDLAIRRYHTGNIVGLIQSFFVGIVLKSLLFLSVLWLWSRGLASVGDVVFIIATYNLIQAHIKSIGTQIRQLQMATNDMEDMVRFSLMSPAIRDVPRAKKLLVKKGVIQFENVDFRYPGQEADGFTSLSLVIPAGQRVALVGHSGAGKSTFVKLIQRLHDLDGGRIAIDGQDISKVTQESLRRAVSLVPQDPVLFHRSLAENIAYARPRASAREIIAAAKAAHAHEFIVKLPAGYDTLVGERGVKLSGGERQRVAIARAMLAAAPILILDEATSALDSESEGYIQDALTKLMQGRTSIVVAHRLSTIRAVDRILVFEGGEIVEDGSHTELLRKKKGIYKKLYELQQGGYLGE